MKDFIFAALSWILTGLTVTMVCAFHGKREETCQIQGMLLGMAAGSLLSALGVMTAGLGISMGMLVGQGIGLLIPRKPKAGGEP